MMTPANKSIELRDYQIEKANEAYWILSRLGIVYICAEVRTGKTLMSLKCADLMNIQKVLFLTKKEAISSIESDYAQSGFQFSLFITNNESLHKIENPKSYDLIIIDEAHRLGGFPKPGARTKTIKNLFKSKPIILLSGTPSPESWSQLYHQFWICDRSPFNKPETNTFYKWAKSYVNVISRYLGHGLVKDYSDARLDLIGPIIEPYMVRLTQAQAGFQSKINETIVFCDVPSQLENLIARLIQHRVIVGKTGTLSATKAVLLQQKVHQLYSGTVLLDEDSATDRGVIISDYKAQFMKQYLNSNFPGQKVVIFYKFKMERELLLHVFGDQLTDDMEEYRFTDKSLCLQIVTGREGTRFSEAAAIFYFNIDFSATSYWQSRDRMTTIDRLESNIYWFFAKDGIEDQIYTAVSKKKNYTLAMFKKRFNVRAVSPK